ncbi:MAG: EAL domain-containing protein [Thermomicrobiales bacterium]
MALTQFSIQKAFEAIRVLSLPIAINLSVAQLHTPALAQRIVQAAAAWEIDPRMLLIEITESAALMAYPDHMRALRELHELGIQIAIDDFGTSYSDLATIRTYPIDALKIDRGFVIRLATGSREVTIASAIIAIAKALDVAVLAEGIESEEQVLLLRELGCDFGQGHLLGMPVPLSDLSPVRDATPN